MTVEKTILEVKEKLNGERHEFAGTLLAEGPGEVITLYILPRDGGLGGVPLVAGTRSLGYFWTDRPYNVYHAVDAEGRTLVFYVNISDRTAITPEAIAWRDLIVDVVVTPGDQPRVLDEDELPSDLDPALGAAIDAARDAFLADHQRILTAVERRTATLLP